MGAIQAVMLMQPWVTGGTNLGTESYSRGDNPDDPAIATARFNFNTTGTVTVTGNGKSTPVNTTPFTNWNTGGGTHISYEIIGETVGGTTPGTLTKTGGLAPSSPYGENRHAATVTAFQLIASGSFDSGSGDIQQGFATGGYKISVWNAATGGTRTAFGIYNLTADSAA